MSSAAEEVMDQTAAEDTELKSEEKLGSSPDKSYLFGAGEIVEGKRAKKSVERLDIQVPKKTEKLSIANGSGEKLGDILRTSHQLNKMKSVDLVPLHTLLFDRRGKLSVIKKNIRLFSGFPFDADSELFVKKRDKLQKSLTKAKLSVVCNVLDLEKKGTHSDLVERIMLFLVSPKSSGKRLPKKKKRSKKRLSTTESKQKKSAAKSSRKEKPTSSPKKSKTGSKSKAIVMDSSSDEDEEEERAAAESEGSEAEGSEGSEGSTGSTGSPGSGSESGDKREEEEVSEEEDDDEEESPKPKARGKPKKTPAKKQKTPKKPAKKRSRKEASDSDSESSEDPEPQRKKPKPAARTKKADSSSNSKTPPVKDSSDEDKPLSKMMKKNPSDDQLTETVKSLLKEADLEELTMKQICQKVFDAYSDHDLSSRKDFIKQTVRSLIT